MPVNALFLWRQLQQIVEVVRLWLINKTSDLNCPWACDEAARFGRYLALFRREFVEIVVVGYVFERSWRFINFESAGNRLIGRRLDQTGNLRLLLDDRGRRIKLPIN